MNKPTLLQLREKYGINIIVLANVAEVKTEIVYAMLVGMPVERWQAEKVLQGFNKLTGVEYNLGDIQVVIEKQL